LDLVPVRWGWHEAKLSREGHDLMKANATARLRGNPEHSRIEPERAVCHFQSVHLRLAPTNTQLLEIDESFLASQRTGCQNSSSSVLRARAFIPTS
jgi:hypothetical protein